MSLVFLTIGATLTLVNPTPASASLWSFLGSYLPALGHKASTPDDVYLRTVELPANVSKTIVECDNFMRQAEQDLLLRNQGWGSFCDKVYRTMPLLPNPPKLFEDCLFLLNNIIPFRIWHAVERDFLISTATFAFPTYCYNSEEIVGMLHQVGEECLTENLDQLEKCNYLFVSNEDADAKHKGNVMQVCGQLETGYQCVQDIVGRCPGSDRLVNFLRSNYLARARNTICWEYSQFTSERKHNEELQLIETKYLLDVLNGYATVRAY